VHNLQYLKAVCFHERLFIPAVVDLSFLRIVVETAAHDAKEKGFPYSLPSVGPGADPGVQAVSPQLTISHPPGGITAGLMTYGHLRRPGGK